MFLRAFHWLRKMPLIPTIALAGVAFVHVVAPNPSQNHMLELRLAAYERLDRLELHEVFEHGASREIIMDKLSPYMSSQACQYWLNYGVKGWLSNSSGRPEFERSNTNVAQAFAAASSMKTLGQVRIHTTELNDVLTRTIPGSLKAVVVEDSANALDKDVGSRVRVFSAALATKGYVVFASQDKSPWHVSAFEDAGFEARHHGSMWWVYTKVRNIG